MPARGHACVGDKRQRYAAVVEIAKEEGFVDIEDGVPFAVLRQRENGLRGLHDLADFQVARGDHACRFGAQCGIAKGVFRRSQLRFCCFKRTFCGSQFFLRLIVDRRAW